MAPPFHFLSVQSDENGSSTQFNGTNRQMPSCQLELFQTDDFMGKVKNSLQKWIDAQCAVQLSEHQRSAIQLCFVRDLWNSICETFRDNFACYELVVHYEMSKKHIVSGNELGVPDVCMLLTSCFADMNFKCIPRMTRLFAGADLSDDASFYTAGSSFTRNFPTIAHLSPNPALYVARGTIPAVFVYRIVGMVEGIFCGRLFVGSASNTTAVIFPQQAKMTITHTEQRNFDKVYINDRDGCGKVQKSLTVIYIDVNL